MRECDLIIHGAGQLLTCASPDGPKKGSAMLDLGIIEDGAVAVVDGKIAAVGKSAEILSEYKSDNVHDAEGRVVLPGFVECHTHLVYAGDRLNEFELKIKGAEYLEILAAGGGILSTVRQTREASMSDLVEQSLPRLDKMMSHGVTTCEIKTGYGLDYATELKMLEAIIEISRSHPMDIVPTFLPAHAVPPEYKDRADEYVEVICEEMLPSVAELFDVKMAPAGIFVDVFCEKNAFDLAQSERVLRKAKGLGFGIKAHVDEFTNLGGARVALALGASSIDHLDAISEAEVRLLAASNTVGVVTPTVNFNFGSKEYANARGLIDAGCAIAVSTDYNPGSAPCPSPLMAMAIAARYQKLLPAEAINGATVNGAFATGVAHQAGSIEVGKNADMLVCDTWDFRELVYEFGGDLINTVLKGGVPV